VFAAGRNLFCEFRGGEDGGVLEALRNVSLKHVWWAERMFCCLISFEKYLQGSFKTTG
jgi:hypothetical protein